MKLIINNKKLPFFEVFDFRRGDSKYTQKYVNENKGLFPIYSSNTKQKGLMGNINTYQFNCECLYLTTNGANAGTLFYKNKHKFSVNGDGCILTKKIQELDYLYLLYILKGYLKELDFNWENKVSKGKLKEIEIKIPINVNGEFDLQKQKEIAQKYLQIEKIKSKIVQDYEEIKNMEIEV